MMRWSNEEFQERMDKAKTDAEQEMVYEKMYDDLTPTEKSPKELISWHLGMIEMFFGRLAGVSHVLPGSDSLFRQQFYIQGRIATLRCAERVWKCEVNNECDRFKSLYRAFTQAVEIIRLSAGNPP